MKDQFGREVSYLRLSITDSCNLRCIYCMPESLKNKKEDNNLTIDEYFETVRIFSRLGIRKVRITGGEPLIRKGIDDLIKKIRSIPEIEEIAVTTNGLLLEKYLDGFIENGVTSMNVSIDSTDKKKFKDITRGGNLEKVVKSIRKAVENGIEVKLNTVIIKGVNDDEVSSLVKFAVKNKVDIRFIELMPIGCARHLKGMKSGEILKIIENSGLEIAERKNENESGKEIWNDGLQNGNSDPNRKTAKERAGPARYVHLRNYNTRVGFISPMSSCFCEDCNRIRVTSDGKIKQCLYYHANVDLKELFRNGGKREEEILKIVENEIFTKNRKHAFNDYEKAVEKREERIMSSIGG